MTTLNETYLRGKEALNNLPSPELDARILLCACLSLSEEEFFAHPERILTAKQLRKFLRLLRQRQNGCPIAYLTGEKEFWSLPFIVKPGVLIPRPETELLVEKTVELSGDLTKTVVDIGTGCGSIAVSLSMEIPQTEVLATDISRRALRIARANSRRNGQTGIRFLHGDLFAPLEKKSLAKRCDFVISNPPYLSAKEWLSCSPEITEHEPKRALVSGVTGLEFIAALIEGAVFFLRPGGYLLFEIGAGQMEGVMSLFNMNWKTVEAFKDLAGIPRVIAARMAE